MPTQWQVEHSPQAQSMLEAWQTRPQPYFPPLPIREPVEVTVERLERKVDELRVLLTHRTEGGLWVAATMDEAVRLGGGVTE